MEKEKAHALVSEMIDICIQFGDEILSEACSGIFNDINAADCTEDIISSANELMVFVTEAPWSDEVEIELKEEIEKIYYNLLEEYNDF